MYIQLLYGSGTWFDVLKSSCLNMFCKISLFLVQYLITNFSDFQLACLGSFFLHESVFFLSGLPFIYLERAGWLSKYKIQVQSVALAVSLNHYNSFLNFSSCTSTILTYSNQLWLEEI